MGRRGCGEDLFQLMNGLDKAAERKWGRVVSLPTDERATVFERISRGYGRTEIIDEPRKVQPLLDVYRKIKEDLLPFDVYHSPADRPPRDI